MYAELKQKKKTCRICGKTKELSNFKLFKKGEKKYPRPFCMDCKSSGNFEWDLWKNYRIRKADYDRMYKEQKGKCACCGKHESEFKRKLHVDHDKETNQVYALLCTRCNPGIGFFKHSVEQMELGIKYLKSLRSRG